MGEDGTNSQFLVVGSGLAGLSFALKAAALGDVSILTKKNLIESNSDYAQGGIAAVLSPDDSFESHIEDTLRLGKGLSDPIAVELMVKRAPAEIQWLIDMGVNFDRINGALSLGREGGHSIRRVAHNGDLTGHAIQLSLIDRVREHPRITINEDLLVTNLLTENECCIGVRALDPKHSTITHFHAPITVLATGGIGHIYSKTSNPEVATGDGISMAWWAGAQIKDIEFVQFHPTILNTGESPYFLISETVRGEGAILRNSAGEAFMTDLHPLKDLAPRDLVSRQIVEEQNDGPVGLDITHRDEAFLRKRFPVIFKRCLESGYNMAKDLIPVSPAAHYLCGGININHYGETSLPGLYAFGECSCSGVHGANRMASNSLLECITFTTFAFKKIAQAKPRLKQEPYSRDIDLIDTPEAWKLRHRLQDIMWTNAGINRSISRLEYGLQELNKIHEELEAQTNKGTNPELIELHSLETISRLIIRAALTRRESRGTHQLIDNPTRDDKNWLKHIIYEKNNIHLIDH